MKPRLSKARMLSIKPGLHVDYRGAYFEVLRIVRDGDGETVAYRAVGDAVVLHLPLAEFAGVVEAFGERYWRFTAVRDPNLFSDQDRRAA